MTNEQFRSAINVTGGQFDFETDKYEGMVGVSHSSVVIWVDDIGYSKPSGDTDDGTEPRNIGYYKSSDDLLEQFKVDGILFSDSVLPEIKELVRILT